MKNIYPSLRKASLFFYGALLCIVLCMLFNFVQGSEPLIARHSFWLNVFFVNYTFMGDAIFVLAVVLFLRFYCREKEKAKTVFYSFLLTMLLIQLFKNVLHHSGFILYFEESQYLFNTAPLSETAFRQLPSSHTALAFSLAASLSSFTKNKLTHILLLLGCGLLAFSRLYLAGHYFMDVVIGMFIGIFSTGTIIFLLKVNTKKNYQLRITNYENPKLTMSLGN